METEEIKKVFKEALYESHAALSKVYSNQQGEILSRLNVIDNRLDTIEDKQNMLTKKTERNGESIEELKIYRAESIGERKVTGRISTALMSIGSSVSVVAILYWLGLRK